MSTTSESHAASAAMIEALQADGPFRDYTDKLMLFGRLVGSWDIVGRFPDEEGNVVKESAGEWHFGWALEGRAIADVLISPPREGREPHERSKAYDLAVRIYDPKIDAWRVTATFPIYGATVDLIAREHGDEIWQEGRSPEHNLLRWTFSDFGDDRARWQGYLSKDEGETWIRDEEIILHRRR